MWTWDPAKERSNRAKHGVTFTAAVRVFGDLDHVSRPDPDWPIGREERWHTVGRPDIDGHVVLFIVHTDINATACVNSARKAKRHERQAYEDGEL